MVTGSIGTVASVLNTSKVTGNVVAAPNISNDSKFVIAFNLYALSYSREKNYPSVVCDKPFEVDSKHHTK